VKRLVIISALFILAVILSTSVFAGEAYQMLMSGGQSALVIGIVESVNEEFSSIKVEKVLMGSISSDVFKLTDTEYSKVPPLKPGEIWVLSLNEHNGNYGIAEGAYQADNTDYKTLNLLSAKEGDIPAKIIQEFINSGVFIEADKKAKEQQKFLENPSS
jgi:hypothetical protein